MRINCKRPTWGKAICLLNFQKGDIRGSGKIKWWENSSFFQIGHKTPYPNHVDKNCNKNSDNPNHKVLKVTEPVFLPETTKNLDKKYATSRSRHWEDEQHRPMGPGNRKPCECAASTQTTFQTTVEEAVWNQEYCSCAQLRGWRYVGFVGSAGNERISEEAPNTVGGVGQLEG